MYQRILVPLDGSELAEQVLPYIRVLARALGSRIELLRAIEPLPPAGLTDPARESYRQETLVRLGQEADDYLKTVAAPLAKNGFTVSTAVLDGTPLSSPAAHILRQGEEDSAALVGMCSHGRSGINRWVLGSVADEVVHASASPVLVIRAKEKEDVVTEVKLETIIVPLDESPLAEQVLPHAASLAQALGLKVILARVTPPVEGSNLYQEYSPPNLEEICRDIDGRAAEYLRQVGQKLHEQGVPVVEERLLHGDPASVIIDLAQSTPNNLVAMTTHGRSGIGRWLLGSIADRVIRYGGDPVLLIRAKE
jgi:nucleotide-binding universal stress UspA family protein